ncbi:MAG: cyanophycinase [Chitinophagaceae bacterium]|nr:MAG: cyanophycinase [Chitinophagaceae bacterium]
MRYNNWLLLLVIIEIFSGCSRPSLPTQSGNGIGTQPPLPANGHRPASLGLIGDTADVNTAVEGGLVLMGGGTDVDAAFQWMIARSGGGDVVVIRASGTNAYNPYIKNLGAVNSVETLKIDSRELANNDTVAAIIRNAEMLFIAGGDQSNYMNYWRDTKTEAAINYLLTQKQAPVGGTSAGCAILSGLYYSGENGSVVSADALQNPHHANITLYNNDFLKAPFLQSVITDQHYLTRSREGRSVVFLARILKDWQIPAKAIAVDERTAVCIDKKGKAKVFGLSSSTRPYSYAYFIATSKDKSPEQLQAGQAVEWKQAEKALSVYEIQASANGNGSFNVADFSMTNATGGKHYWWWIDNGILHKKEQ